MKRWLTPRSTCTPPIAEKSKPFEVAAASTCAGPIAAMHSRVMHPFSSLVLNCTHGEQSISRVTTTLYRPNGA